MSLFFRSSPERRDVSDVPWSHGGPRIDVTGSLDGSLSLVPVHAAVRLISDSIATLPLQAYRRTPDGRVSRPLPAVFERPSNRGTRVEWVQKAATSLLLRGNAYGLLVGSDRDAPGMPSMVEWLNPDKVHWQDGWTYEGREVPEAQILHIPGLSLPGQREGVSPLRAARAMVEGGMEAQAFMRDWYRNKAVPGMTAQNTEKALTSEVAATVKERLRETVRNGEPLVTGKDWKIDVLQLSADDAGFVTSARLTATQVAAIYGIPPEMIGGESANSLTYSTVELNQLNFVTNTLRPWLVRLETAFSSLMPSPQFVKFNVDALIRADTKTRYEVHKLAREIGLNNVDELRALEDQPPLPDSKGQDYTPLAQMGARTRETR